MYGVRFVIIHTWDIPASLLKGTPLTLSRAVISLIYAFISSFLFQGLVTILVAFLNYRCLLLGQTSASSARKKRQNWSREQGRTSSTIFCFYVSTISGLNMLTSMLDSSKFFISLIFYPFSASSSLFELSTSEDNFSFFHSAFIILTALAFLNPQNTSSQSQFLGSLKHLPVMLMVSFDISVTLEIVSMMMAVFLTIPNMLETNMRWSSPMQSLPKKEKLDLRVHLQSWKMVWLGRPRFSHMISVVVFFLGFIII